MPLCIYIGGRYSDPEIGQYVDSEAIENIFLNAEKLLGLDRHAVSYDNIHSVIKNLHNIFNEQGLSPCPKMLQLAKNLALLMYIFRWIIAVMQIVVGALLMAFGGPLGMIGGGLMVAGGRISMMGLMTENSVYDGIGLGITGLDAMFMGLVVAVSSCTGVGIFIGLATFAIGAAAVAVASAMIQESLTGENWIIGMFGMSKKSFELLVMNITIAVTIALIVCSLYMKFGAKCSFDMICKDAEKIAASFKKCADDIGAGIGSASSAISEFGKGCENLGAGIGAGLQGISDSVGGFGDSFSKIGDGIAAGVDKVAGSLENFGGKIGGIGGNIAGGITQISDSIGSFGDSFSKIGDGIAKGVDSVSGALGRFGDNIGGIGGKIAGGIDSISKSIETFGQSLSSVGGGIADSITKISESIGSFGTNIGKGLSDIAGGISSFGDAFANIGAGIASVGAGFGAIGDGIMQIGNGLAGAADGCIVFGAALPAVAAGFAALCEVAAIAIEQAAGLVILVGILVIFALLGEGLLAAGTGLQAIGLGLLAMTEGLGAVIALMPMLIESLAGITDNVGGIILFVLLAIAMVAMAIALEMMNGQLETFVSSMTELTGLMSVGFVAAFVVFGLMLIAMSFFMEKVANGIDKITKAIGQQITKLAILNPLLAAQAILSNPFMGAVTVALAIAGGLLVKALLPAMATGGVVSSPTVAMVGEGRYPEAVVPLGDSPQFASMKSDIANAVLQGIMAVSGKGGSRNSEQNTEVVLNIDGSKFARAIIPAINQEQRRKGLSLAFQEV